VCKPFVHAVGNGTIVVKRSEHFLDGVQDIFQAMNIEEGFLLTGKRSIRQIFGSGRRADGKRGFGAALGNECSIVDSNFFFQLFRKRGFNDPLTNLGTGLQQRIDIVHIQAGQTGIDLFGQTVVGEERTVGFGSGRKTTRHPYASGGQLADHFTQRCVLATDLFHVSHAQFFEVFNKGVHKDPS